MGTEMKPEEIIEIIRQGNFKQIKKLVESGLDVNTKFELGLDENTKFESYDSIVIEAAYANQSEIVRFLIEKGADIESKSIDGSTPLSWAITHNDADLVNYLCSKGADVNYSSDGIKMLTQATYKGSTEMVKTLLENGANPNTGDARYVDPAFLCAAKDGHIEIVKLLLKYKIKKYTAGNEDALAAACRYNQVEVVKLLLKEGKFKLNQNKPKMKGDAYYSPLEESCREGHIECARFLLEAGADPNFAFSDPRKTPIVYAVMGGHLEIVKLLHKNGAIFEYNDRYDPDIDDFDNRWNPLGIACYYDQFEIVKYLVENGADPTVGITHDHDYTPIDHAESRGYKDILKYLTGK